MLFEITLKKLIGRRAPEVVVTQSAESHEDAVKAVRELAYRENLVGYSITKVCEVKK